MSCKTQYIYHLKGLTEGQKDSLNEIDLSIWREIDSYKIRKSKVFRRNTNDQLVNAKSFYVKAANKVNEINKKFGVRVVQFISTGKPSFNRVKVDVSVLADRFRNQNEAEKKSLNDFTNLGINFEGDSDVSLFGQKDSLKKEPIKELDDRLTSFLGGIGVTVENYSRYKERYLNKNGEEFDGIALADMLNKLVVVKEGQAKIDTLPEETAHFVIEALGYDHTVIKPLLKMVESTDTYKNTFNTYKDDVNYQNKDKTPNIEKIKVESLGKILADVTIKKFKEDSSLSTRFVKLLSSIWKSFLSRFRSDSHVVIQNHIEKSLGSIASDILSGKYQGYELPSLRDKTFYQKDKAILKSEILLRESIKVLKSRLAVLEKKKSKAIAISNIEVTIAKLEKELEDEQMDLGIVYFINHALENNESVMKYINNVESTDIPVDITRLNDMEDFIVYYKDVLGDISYSLEFKKVIYDILPDNYKGKTKEELYQAHVANVDKVISDFSTITKFHKDKTAELGAEYIQEKSLLPGYNAEESIKETTGDISWLQYFFGSLKNADNNILRIAHNIVNNAKQKIHRYTYGVGKSLLNLKEELNLTEKDLKTLYEKDSEGNTGFLVSEYNQGKYNKDKNRFFKSLLSKLNLSEDSEAREKILEEDVSKSKEWKLSWKTWHKENSGSLHNWREVVDEVQKNLSDSEFQIWYNMNVTISEKGKKEYPKGSLLRPSDKYLNTEYDKIINNDNLNKYYEKLIELKKEALDKQPLKYRLSQNVYKLPQISKTFVQRLKLDKHIFKQFPELIKDEFLSRVDDDIFSDESDLIGGKKVRYIPIRYNNMLENTDDISEDITALFIEYADMSENFKQMSEIAPDLENVKDQMSKTRVKLKNKMLLGAETNAFKALDKFLDMMVYGGMKEKLEIKVSESIPLLGGKTINVTKIVNRLATYIRANNLVGNTFTIAVNSLSGSVFARIERLTGQYSSTESGNWAHKKLVSNLSEVVSDMGIANKSNKMHLMFELHSVFKGARETFKDSNLSRAGKFVNDNLFYGLYSMGDYTMKGTMSLSVFDNFRLHEGKWHTKNSFMNTFYKDDTKAGNEAWKSIRDKSYYNAFEVKNKIPVIKEEFKKFIDDNTMNLMSSKVRTVNAEVDGQVDEIDRAAIHQGTFAQLFSIHRGWLFTGLQKRMKKVGVNYSTGEMEEGYYRTIVKNFKAFVFNVYNPVLKKHQLASWSELNDMEKYNLMRGIYELRMVTVVYMTTLLLNHLADDDDEDDWLIQMPAYLSSRLLLETSVFLPPFVVTEGMNTFKSPVAGINQLELIISIWDTIDSDEIKSGPYAGMTRGQKNLIKLTPGLKGWFEATDPRSKNKFLRMQALNSWYGL